MVSRKFIDRAGERFGRLLVLRRGPNCCKRLTTWVCRCDCGHERTVTAVKLVTGKTRSCGCLSKEMTAARSRTHGHTVGRKISAEYRTWAGIRSRCLGNHPNYGGRGIRICDRWLESFENFLADMGPRPSAEHSIDRIDSNWHYESGNCRWATRKEQGQNRRDIFLVEDGPERVSLKEFARRRGANYAYLYKLVVMRKVPLQMALGRATKIPSEAKKTA